MRGMIFLKHIANIMISKVLLISLTRHYEKIDRAVLSEFGIFVKNVKLDTKLSINCDVFLVKHRKLYVIQLTV